MISAQLYTGWSGSCVLPKASCGKPMISAIICSNHNRGRIASPALILQLPLCILQRDINVAVNQYYISISQTSRSPNPSSTGTRFGFLLFGIPMFIVFENRGRLFGYDDICSVRFLRICLFQISVYYTRHNIAPVFL